MPLSTPHEVLRPEEPQEIIRKLRESQTEIEGYYQNAPVGLCVLDRQLRYRRINEILAEIDGIPVAEHLGKTLREVVPDVADKAEKVLRRVFETGEPFLGIEGRGELIGDTGVRRRWLASCFPIKNTKGEVMEVTVMAQDITERMQAEAAAARYRLISQYARDPLLLVEMNGELVEANQAAVKLYGYTREELLKLNIKDLRQSDDPETVEQQMLKASAEGLLFEALHTRKDGSRVPVEVSSRGVMVEGQLMLLSVIRDITARKQVEQALQESEMRLARTQAIAHLGSWEHDLTCNHLIWSAEVFRIFGLQPEEFNGMYEGFLVLVHPEDRVKVDSFYCDSLHQGLPRYEVEHRIVRTATEEVRWVHERWQHVRDASGKVVRALGMVQDITERKRAEERRNITLELLNLANSCNSKREFVQSAVDLLLLRSSCDAVGIRLREGDDYPYFEARGFTPEFIAAENSLCARHPSGCARYDASGEVILECICGCVLRNQPDFAEYRTEHGSFWTSDARGFADSLSGTALSQLRGRCLTAGFQSIALIPLGRKENRIGLLQLECRPKGHFTPDIIAFWERLAGKLSVAIIEFQAKETLQKAHEELEQRVAERTDELNRANRALLTLNACNEAIAQASTESELLTKICQIIREMRGVKMVWVGFAEHDEQKTVRPVSFAGAERSDMENAGITWANEPRGRGPTGTAIRTQKVVVCPDIASEPDLAPWQTQQLQRGYAALIALPLIWRDDCLGALSIFSGQLNAFNSHEVNLLKQLARDVAFGIVNLRARVGHERLQKELLGISEREKHIISQELHDGLCQNLAGTAFMSSVLRNRLEGTPGPDAKLAKDICELLCTTVNEARNLSHGLHPVGPEGEGLMNALSQLASTVRNLFHIQCTFRCPEQVFIENETVSTHFFRITQEAINNARKHGEADRVSISLCKTPKGLTLTVRDNGVGMPVKIPKKSGMGLGIMKHRAAAIGATLKVTRGTRGGTVVTCNLPC